MSFRGRGTLEVKPSSNPFFQSTASDIGVDPSRQVKWKHDVNPSLVGSANYSNDGTFAFLYTRESDTIGSRVAKPTQTVDTHKLMSRTEFLKKRREDLMAAGVTGVPMPNAISTSKVSAEEVLKSYKHNPKIEDPRYTTSSNDFGAKVPTVATFVAERAARQQGFSKSFNNVKPQNTSLNTYLTKSNVHPSLDPQFV